MVNRKVVEIESTCLLLTGALGMFCIVVMFCCAIITVNRKVVEIESTCLLLTGSFVFGMFCIVCVHQTSTVEILF